MSATRTSVGSEPIPLIRSETSCTFAVRVGETGWREFAPWEVTVVATSAGTPFFSAKTWAYCSLCAVVHA